MLPTIPFLLSALSVLLVSQTGDPAPALPSGEEVLARFVAATGGQAAHDRIENRVTLGILSMEGGRVRLPLKSIKAKPARSHSRDELPGLGPRERGATAEVAWERSALVGTMVYEGLERAELLRQAVFDRYVYWRTVWKEVECVGTKEVDGEVCYELAMTPKAFDETELRPGAAPEPNRACFSQKTGLLVMFTLLVPSVGGPPVVTEVHQSMYRKVDGILLPFRVEQRIEGHPPGVTEIHTIQHNVLLLPSQFALPAEVRKIVDERRRGG
ncbi:MAG: hypothetical protein AB1726_14265 [Planctomycetota bacterium]